jgi:hypothetical protein
MSYAVLLRVGQQDAQILSHLLERLSVERGAFPVFSASRTGRTCSE